MSNCASSTKDEICRAHRVFLHSALSVLCQPVCCFLCADPVVSLESSVEFIPGTSVHFRDLGNLLAQGTKKLQRSDPVLADISRSIVGHSGNKKLPCYGNSARMLKPR